MNAWSNLPFRTKFSGRTALERRELVFQGKQCRLPLSTVCGGKRGPALDRVALRLTQDELIRQVVKAGNMPPWQKLEASETTALVAFLGTLHPPTSLLRATLHAPKMIDAICDRGGVAVLVDSHPVTLAPGLSSGVYVLGWYRLRRASDDAIGGHLAAFAAAMMALWIAVGLPSKLSMTTSCRFIWFNTFCSWRSRRRCSCSARRSSDLARVPYSFVACSTALRLGPVSGLGTLAHLGSAGWRGRRL
jgi:hypothetical protein